MKKIIDKILMAALPVVCLLGSCTREQEEDAFDKGEPVTLQINREPFAPADGTRATDTDYTTSFATGDRIGVFAVANDGSILDNNVPYQYNGSTWTPVNSDNTLHHYNYTTVTYLAYYPYSAAMDNTGTEAGIVDKFTPQTDQSTKEGYTKSDLMVGTGTLSGNKGNKTLSLTMKHKMAMVECSLKGSKKQLSSGYTFYSPYKELKTWTVGTVTAPYEIQYGIFRALVKPASMVTIDISYTEQEGKGGYYSRVVPLMPGQYTRMNMTMTGTDAYSLSPGDRFMKDGSILSKDLTLTESQKRNCIGLVFSTTTSATDQAHGWKTGYVIATQATTNNHIAWLRGETANGNRYAWSSSAYNDLDGYTHTMEIHNKYGFDSGYEIFDACLRHTPKPNADVVTSGWYVPSSGQFAQFVNNLGVAGSLTSSSYKGGPAITVFNNIKSKIEAAGGEFIYSAITTPTLGNYVYYWTSTTHESAPSSAWSCNFNDSGNLMIVTYGKGDYSNERVRAVLAF